MRRPNPDPTALRLCWMCDEEEHDASQTLVCRSCMDDALEAADRWSADELEDYAGVLQARHHQEKAHA